MSEDNYFCEKCGQHWVVHNADGGCVQDDVLTDEAFDLGRWAFLKGMPCVPALDAAFLAQSAGKMPGEFVEFGREWIRGWTFENLGGELGGQL